MILIENVTYLKGKFPVIWERVKGQPQFIDSEKIRLENAKNGMPTLAIRMETGWNYLHSKYDPAAEAEKTIKQYENVDGYKHVFFYGMGMGYHIDEFLKKHPDLPFSIYEPNPSIFLQYLSHKRIDELAGNRLEHIYLETNETDIASNAEHFIQSVKDEVLFVVHPSYERIYQFEYKALLNKLRESLYDRRGTLHTNIRFEKLWTLNSLLNLPFTANTSNIICDNLDEFQGKPAIIVAAGPSLDFEYDNLKYIKENGLAYIFSVGSAINSLIENGIYPDAACTYDPALHNHKVFEKVSQRGEDHVPLIFGSSVGYETLQRYSGPKYHMLIHQDTVSPYFLRRADGNPIDFVYDSPSIAIVTLQLLYKLGCNPVILVGQNLSYFNKKMYSQGIEYDYRPSKMNEQEIRDAILVNDVDGNEIYSSKSFINMKTQLEMFIGLYKDFQVINTTKGGAAIEGASFIPLEKVIRERLISTNTVTDAWSKKSRTGYDLNVTADQFANMEKELMRIPGIFNSFFDIFAEMNKLIITMNHRQLESTFVKFDRAFDKLQSNHFHTVFLQPMNRVRFEQIMKTIEEIRFQRDIVKKAKRITKEFKLYLECCEADIEVVKPILEETRQRILGSSR